MKPRARSLTTAMSLIVSGPISALAANLVSTVTVHPAQTLAPVSPLLQFGSNTPAWLGSNYGSTTFINRTKASGLGLIRIPGGSLSDQFGWLSCENRVYQQGKSSVCYLDDAGSHWESWITRPTDFITFLKAAGKQALYTVNVNATAQEAAAAVAFFNAQTTNTTAIGVDRNGFDWKTTGYWAQLRATHGNAAPFPITYWEIGNEVYGGQLSKGGSGCQSWGWEYAWTCDGGAYIAGDGKHDGFARMRAAMLKVDPTIKVGAVGFEDATSYNGWGMKVLQKGGQVMDFYSVHPYAYDTPPSSWATILAQPRQRWPQLAATLSAAFKQYAGGRAIPVAATEFNLEILPDYDAGRMINSAGNMLFVAETLGQAVQAKTFAVNQWDLANGCSSSGACFDLLQVDKGFQRSPQYFAYPLWSKFGASLLAVDSNLNASSQFSVYAGRIDAATYSLLAINKTANTVQSTVYFDNGAFIVGGTADAAQAASLSDTAVTYNGKTSWTDDLSSAPSLPLTQVGAKVQYNFPPYSVSLLRMSALPAYPATAAVCNVDCSGSGVADCVNGASRTLASFPLPVGANLKSVTVSGKLTSYADTCFATGAISTNQGAAYQNKACGAAESFSLNVPVGAKAGTFSLSLSHGDWCTKVENLAIRLQ